jgi:carbonic anhydrase/acetyltransferase-like protein (isoleucine patch superfamily)
MIFALDNHVPRIHDSAWIAHDANVIGRVEMAEDTSVWFGATLRGDLDDIRIGRGSNVQEASVLHTDRGLALIVGEDCTIGHKAILHGCIIGDCSLIGMGATVLNRARIGRHCLIGAGALVTEGKEIPDGALVLGSPGKVVRMLTEEEKVGLAASAAHYRENAARFRSGLRPVVRG